MHKLFPAALTCLFAVSLTSVHAQTQTADAPGGPASAIELPQVDPTGQWEWSTGFGGRPQPQKIQLSEENGKLTGSYQSQRRGRRGAEAAPGFADPIPLSKVQLKGDKLSFEVTRSFGEREFTTIYSAVISGDEIAGVSAFSFGGGQVRESAWMASRKSDLIDSLAAMTPAKPETGESAKTQPEDVNAVTAEQSTQSTGAPSENSGAVEIPKPTRIPDAGQGSEQAYTPKAILPGGIVIPLYSSNSPLLNQEKITEPEKYNLSGQVHGRINSIVNIHNPSIEVHFARPGMNTGAVVILAAGGGHRTLNVGTESADFVPFFYNYGVNTVILRNRLRSDGYEPATDAVHDAMQAIRLVRKHASEWKIDPARIGIMGFSAGAELSAPAAVQFEQFDADNNQADDPLAGVSSRPDFVGIIYPGPTPFTKAPETTVPKNTPPAFLATPGAGDRVHALWATDYFTAMLKAGIPNVEFHVYGNGFHPGTRGAAGGLGHRDGIPFGTWHHRFIDWFDDLGFLSPSGTTTKAAQDTQEFVDRPARRPRR